MVLHFKCTKIKSSGKFYKFHDILSLLGHNGAGKTTTINMLIGLIKSNAGNVEGKNKFQI